MFVSAEQKQLETQLDTLTAELKKLTGLLADKGAGPQRVGPGLLNAMLKLKGSQGADSDDEDSD